MKNREKYIDEIITMAASGTSCRFMIDNVMPNFIDNNVNVDTLCEDGKCCECSMLFALWLDEEYIEPPKPEVDWSNVPVDTLVRVRDREDQEWILMYFKGISDYDRAHRFMTWCDGATSKTACGGEYMMWKYCELVEDEDDGSN